MAKMLSEREKTILKLRYDRNGKRINTLAYVGNLFNISRERVRQIEAKACRKLATQGISPPSGYTGTVRLIKLMDYKVV